MELQAAALPAALRGEAPWEYEGEEVTQDGVDERGVHTMVAQGMYGPLLFLKGTAATTLRFRRFRPLTVYGAGTWVCQQVRLRGAALAGCRVLTVSVPAADDGRARGEAGADDEEG